jgi:predicted lipoprotein with Yx(FWY)xxD motif
MMVALALLTAACGGDDLDAATQGAADDAGGAAVTEVDLAVGGSELGDILVDGDGMTLYLFTNDRDGESVCEDDCAAAWPPLVVDGDPVAGDGVDASLLSTTERSDGDIQVTYAGWPLYTWAQDQEPGDVTGQGVNDVWFVVDPDGRAITDSDEADAPEASRTDGY